MDRRTTLAIVLCFLIYMGWQKFYLEPRMPHQPTQTAQTAETTGTQTQAVTSPGTPNTVAKAAPSRPSETVTLPTGTGDAVLNDSSGFFSGWKLKSYRLGLSSDTAAVDLQSVTNESTELEIAFDDPAFAYLSNAQGKLEKTPSGARWTYEDSNIRLTREFSGGDQQLAVPVQVTAEFKKKRPSFAFVSLVVPHVNGDPEERDRGLVYFTDNSIERVHPKDASLKQILTPVKYIGVSSRYFAMAVLNNGPLSPTGLVQPIAQGVARGSLVYPVSGNSITIPLRVFFGPKELDVLRAVDPTLDHLVDFGFFTMFAYPILRFLKWLYGFVGNYGVAIIILTLILKLATYPLTYKSMKSMKEMAKLQPQLQKLREKYKDDKEALNRETLQMMRTHGYNPVAGCAPMLIQLPIFWALYRVLYNSIDLYHAPFFGYIQDLSAKDPLYITPILLSLTMFIQQKLTPNTATDPAQQKMMQLMPLIFGAFMLTLPSGLTLYMLANAVASIVQQLILNRKFDRGSSGGAPVLASAR